MKSGSRQVTMKALAQPRYRAAIKDLCFFNMLCMGIHFYSCILVNFEFERDKAEDVGEVEHQKIIAWQADWQRNSNGNRAKEMQKQRSCNKKARAHAWATLLTSIAEGLHDAPVQYPNLPRNLVAVRFMGALEEMLQRQPDGDGKSEISNTMNTWKIRLSTTPKRE